jgi:hypothetical protein
VEVEEQQIIHQVEVEQEDLELHSLEEQKLH